MTDSPHTAAAHTIASLLDREKALVAERGALFERLDVTDRALSQLRAAIEGVNLGRLSVPPTPDPQLTLPF
jgi:hypothetical protein